MEEKNSNNDLVVGKDGSISDGSETQIPVTLTSSQPAEQVQQSAEAVDSISAPQIPTQDSVSPIVSSGGTENNDSVDSVVEAPAQNTEMATVSESLTENTEDSIRVNTSADFKQESLVSQMTPKPEQPIESKTSIAPGPAKLDTANKNNKMFAVIITIVIALLLASLAVYVYLSAENNTQKTPATNNNVQTNQQEESDTLTSDDSTSEQTVLDETQIIDDSQNTELDSVVPVQEEDNLNDTETTTEEDPITPAN